MEILNGLQRIGIAGGVEIVIRAPLAAIPNVEPTPSVKILEKR